MHHKYKSMAASPALEKSRSDLDCTQLAPVSWFIVCATCLRRIPLAELTDHATSMLQKCPGWQRW